MLNNLQTILKRVSDAQNVAYLMLILFGTLLLFGVFVYNSERKRLNKKSSLLSKIFQAVLLISGLILLTAPVSFYLVGENILTSEYLPNIALSLLNLSLMFIIVLLVVSFRSRLFKSPKILILLVGLFLLSIIGLFPFCSPSYQCGVLGTFLNKIVEINGYLLENMDKLAIVLIGIFAFGEAIYWIYKKMNKSRSELNPKGLRK